MRLILLLALLCFFLTSACKKESFTFKDNPVGSGKKYAIKFKPTGFSQSTVPMSFRRLSATDPSVEPQTFTFVVFDESGTEVLRRAVAGATTTDSLPAGKYTACFASNGLYYYKLNGAFSEFEPNFLPLSQAYFHFKDGGAANNSSIHDLFYKKLTFTVSDQDIEQEVKLERVVGQLEVVVTNKDDYEEEVMISPIDFSYGFSLDSGKVHNVNGYDDSQDPYPANHTFYVVRTDEPIAVELDVRVQLPNETKYIHKRIENVMVHRNQKTILTGKLTDDPEVRTDSFHVSYDPTWGTDSTQVGF